MTDRDPDRNPPLPEGHIRLDGNIIRGGVPGKYFFYRADEILVWLAALDKAEELLGKLEPAPPSGEDDRSRQRRTKREARAPFGVGAYRFRGTDARGKSLTLSTAVQRLGDRVADYNYVTARSPMRSHAVSYAEPADPREIDPPLPAGKRDGLVKVGVLDTGRPYYSDEFNEYFEERRRSGGGAHKAPRGELPSLRATDVIFVDPPRATSRGAGPADDQDTLVKPFGRLAHPHAGHGLFVSSIIARHAPTVGIVVETTMSHDAIGDLYDMLLDLDDARSSECRLLNISMGFPTEEDRCPSMLEQAVGELSENGVLVVASAGNDGGSRPVWPAALDDVVAVAATDIDGNPTDWSNYGEWVNACAYGNEVVSNYVFADWDFPDGTAKRFRGAARWSGTSFAAPLVTAMIANEMAKGSHPDPRAAWEQLEEDGEPIPQYGVYLRHTPGA
jgi:hypothetical protein